MATNYERIKNMNVEELAEFLTQCASCELCPISEICPEDTTYKECPTVFKQWLESEAENEK